MCPAIVSQGSQRGYIIPIGGGEDKDANPVILERFVEIAGGQDANIVVFPTASRLEDTGLLYEQIFEKLGAGTVSSIPISSREDCNNPEFAERCSQATGIFITGGNQLRLSTILGGTAVAQMIRTCNASGVPVAGTSAGASIMSEHMMAGGASDQGPSEGGATLAPGLGLTNAAVIDQHFSERNRLGRLLSAVSLNPFLLGMGIDEDTAAFIGPDSVMDIVGSGTVTIVDGSDMSYSSAHSAGRSQGLSMLGLKLDILHEGCHYDLNMREAFPPVEDDHRVCSL
ncbi:cyanophycinase [Sphingorhabdus sp. Alg239-R122]|uniref:cyanophycinase n=1 Tax=Sphingorhabdus sp. Alg239-R122 TaxID=2305989 RepID=UPI0013DC6C4B|nr:cyanophycinase [Sphingorhabdus sp. Alg239-R122]